MKSLKKLLCFIMLTAILLFPLSVSATETDTGTAQPFSFTVECFVGGMVPKDAEFTFSVMVGDYEWDTVENLKQIENFTVSTKDNPDGRKTYTFPESVKSGGVYYSFKLISTTAKLAIPDTCEYHIYFADSRKWQ